jgi:arylformamidase
MRHTIFSSLLVAVGLTAAAPVHAGPLRDLVHEFVVRREAVLDKASMAALKLPAGAEVSRNLAYGPDNDQKLDVYRPADPRNAPIIVMVHGGAWMLGDKVSRGVINEKAVHWLPEGYILVSVNYPMLPETDPLGQAMSVGRALAFVQAHAAEWGGDAKRIVMMGHSAGAHLVSLLAADAGLAKKTGAKPWLGTVALDTAAFDVPAIMGRRHLALYDRAFGRDPAFWRRVSPVDNIVGKPSPMLLVCSTVRRDLPCNAARRFQDRLQAHGTHVRILRVALPHRAVDADLGRPGDYTTRVDGFLRGLGLP